MIGNMAAWRNAAGGEFTGVDNWWDNGNNQIAFSRNGAAFIAFNKEVGAFTVRAYTFVLVSRFRGNTLVHVWWFAVVVVGICRATRGGSGRC